MSASSPGLPFLCSGGDRAGVSPQPSGVEAGELLQNEEERDVMGRHWPSSEAPLLSERMLQPHELQWGWPGGAAVKTPLWAARGH